jgi:hypothetical protein
MHPTLLAIHEKWISFHFVPAPGPITPAQASTTLLAGAPFIRRTSTAAPSSIKKAQLSKTKNCIWIILLHQSRATGN